MFAFSIRRDDQLQSVIVGGERRDQVIELTTTDTSTDCGRSPGLAFSEDGSEVGRYLYERIGPDDHLFVAAPLNQAADLLNGQPSLRFPADIVGTAGINSMRFSERFVVVDLSGRVLVGDRRSGEVVDVSQLPGAPSGSFNEHAIAGEHVFVGSHDGTRGSWWVVRGGALEKVLGNAETTVRSLASNGQVAIWAEGVLSGDADGEPSKFSLHIANADAALSERRVLLPEMDGVLSWTVFSATRATAVSYVPTDPNVVRAWVIETDSGEIRESVLPDGYSWGILNYPTETELWGAIGKQRLLHRWETIARVPYESMTVIQSGYP
jgi:hypothetical protein